MSEPELICPTIDLFLYDLREGFGDNDQQIQNSRYYFWRKIYHDLNNLDPSIRNQKLNQKLRVEGAAEENADRKSVV